LIYLLLWIVLPPARTTAEKLEMRGEPVTFENIGKFVKEEFGQVKKNMKF
ncbi:MAG: PspC family transcriptional regulator, partial [Bacteroidales bacterium]|nr:PspC family transcriptional regulator [Bacteroidales bacterium]